MNGLSDAVHAGWKRIVRIITTEHGDASFAKPRCHGGMQSRRVPPSLPRPVLRPSRPSAGADKHDVAARNSDASLTLPGFEIFDPNCSARLKIRDALETCHVH